MAAITRPVLEGRAQLVLAWLAVLIPLAWGIRAAMEEAAALELSSKLGLTVLPLLLGVAVCFFFFTP